MRFLIASKWVTACLPLPVGIKKNGRRRENPFDSSDETPRGRRKQLTRTWLRLRGKLPALTHRLHRAHLATRVPSPRPDQPIVLRLLDDVGTPAGDARH